MGVHCLTTDFIKSLSNPVLNHVLFFQKRYGFVEFDDPRDADDAVYDLNGKELCGERVIVEHTKGPRRDGGYGGRSKCLVEYLFHMHNVNDEGSRSIQGNFNLNFEGAKSKACPWWLMCIQFIS